MNRDEEVLMMQNVDARPAAVRSIAWLGLLCCIDIRIQRYTTERAEAKLRRNPERISEPVQREADFASTARTANAIKLINNAASEREKPD